MSKPANPPRIFVALATAAALAGPAAAATSSVTRTLVLDAQATSARTAGPDPSHVGHLQIVRGVLRDTKGRQVGSFAYTCRWIAILPGGDAREHCSGHGRTADGRINYAGNTTAQGEPHTFHVVSGTGAYRKSHGRVLGRDLGPSESLIILELIGAQALQVGVVQQPVADRQFRTRASAICRQAAAALARLPHFPFTNFDPTHPDPKLLPKVGGFFTGSGDPRPALRRLDRRLRALGQPPAARPAWARYLAGRRTENAARQEQDNAALAADVQKFVKSLHDIDAASRHTAIAAVLFGIPTCTL